MIFDFFTQNSDKEYIMGLNLSELKSPRKMPERIKAYHFFMDSNIKPQCLKHYICAISRRITRLFFFEYRKYFKGLPIYEGAQWWGLSRDCVLYFYKYYQDNKDELRKYFSCTFCPDEMLVQTIVFNSHFGKKALLYDKGDYPGLVGLTPLHYIEYNGGISIYTETDFDKLMESGKMFVRKTVTGISDKLMDMIDEKREK